MLAQANAGTGNSLEQALVREDGAVLYPISHGIPVLLRDRAVHITPPAAAEPGV